MATSGFPVPGTLTVNSRRSANIWKVKEVARHGEEGEKVEEGRQRKERIRRNKQGEKGGKEAEKEMRKAREEDRMRGQDEEGSNHRQPKRLLS